MNSQSFPNLDSMELVIADMEVENPETHKYITVSLFAGRTSIYLFDSLNNAYRCQFSWCPTECSIIDHHTRLVNCIKTHSIVCYAFNKYTTYNLGRIPLQKLKPLCKEFITDEALLHRLENDFYPSTFTGLK